jgi:hypothetical protein
VVGFGLTGVPKRRAGVKPDAGVLLSVGPSGPSLFSLEGGSLGRDRGVNGQSFEVERAQASIRWASATMIPSGPRT